MIDGLQGQDFLDNHAIIAGVKKWVTSNGKQFYKLYLMTQLYSLYLLQFP